MAIITEKEGDIFDAPANSVLLHACNAQGAWGKGVALEFKKKFPQAYHEYAQLCKTKPLSQPTLAAHQRSLAGSSLVTKIKHPPNSFKHGGSYVYIASLITSVGYGKSKSDVATILKNTAEGIRQLKAALEQCELEGVTVGDVNAVRINSGLFKVPWEETKKVLEQGELDITVMSPPPTGSDIRRSEMAERDERVSRRGCN